VAGSAIAGEKDDSEVVISDTYKEAYGSMAAARASSDGFQEIGCYTYGYAVYGFGGYCWATDPSGVTRYCGLNDNSNEYTWEAASTVAGDSYLEFGWDNAGNCSYVHVTSDSTTGPKVP